MRKTCFKCLTVKPIEEYYKHNRMADGHLNKCKECTKNDVRTHRDVNERPREYDRERYYNNPARKAHIRANAERWDKANRAAYLAHGIVANAVRDGRLTKEPCRLCKAENVHAHHEDYTKPLEVEWLCPRCHATHLRYEAKNYEP